MMGSANKPVEWHSTAATVRELPRDLKERKQIYAYLMPLKELLFVRPERYYVARLGPQLGNFDDEPEQRIRHSELDVGPRHEHLRFEFRNMLSAYNLRMAEIAREVGLLADSLRIAGLSPVDLACWEVDAVSAAEIRQLRGQVATDRADDYVHSRGFSYYELDHLDVMKNIWPEVRKKLIRSTGLVRRLARRVARLDRTLSPDAIAQRFHVDQVKGAASLDRHVFEELTHNELIYLHHLRRVRGEWVSSRDIETLENIPDFKVKRCTDRFEKKYPALLACIEVDSSGSRLVLPMPALTA